MCQISQRWGLQARVGKRANLGEVKLSEDSATKSLSTPAELMLLRHDTVLTFRFYPVNKMVL